MENDNSVNYETWCGQLRGQIAALETALATEREKREMAGAKIEKLRDAIEKEIAVVDGDERHHYKPATVQVNVVLALIQVDLEARIKLAKRLLQALDETETEGDGK